MVHLQFVLFGPPISHQTKDRVNLGAWKKKVRAAAIAIWGSKPPLSGKLKFTLINFHEGEEPPMDDDNMVKPIRDALNGCIFDDDKQIRHSETIHFPIDGLLRIRGACLMLLEAFHGEKEFLFVQIEDAPTSIQLPK